MDYELFKAPVELKGVFSNLLQFYYYDFSEFLKFDTLSTGAYEPYQYLDDYWISENERFPYLLKVGGNWAGFVMVRREVNEGQAFFSIAEFFIMRKYRLGGLGKAVAWEIFDLYRGKWRVSQKEMNKPAQVFWRKTIAEYTDGRYSERPENDKIVQSFQND